MPSAPSIARPAVAAVALLLAVAVTAGVLYVFWPAGVAVGLALGVVAVLAIGASMQRSAQAQATDVELAAVLGLAVHQHEQPAQVEELVTEQPDAEQPAIEQPVAEQPEAEEPEAEQPVVEQPVAEEPEPEPEDRPALPAQADVLYFTSDEDPDRAEPREVVAPDVRTDLERLKAELGDDYRDFARAARLVVSTQYASAARLQRDLDLPYSRARRLLADLEQQHFVGPATGSLPRQVLMPKERLPEVERLLAEV